ncbi:unnamed protein product [Orchesella dallaii]|uniref:PSI domain-containing protein n=1 Tax=Orchesella dallaii TaxID=48710 RepID=A0ABP1QRH1_9HEXA
MKLSFELANAESKNNLFYEIIPSGYRRKRDVTPPPEVPDDKRELLKGPGPTGKKFIPDDTKVLPTVQSPENSTNSNGLNPSLPNQTSQQVDIGNNGATSEATKFDENLPFADEDLLFDGNSSYLQPVKNNTYYQQPQQTITLRKVGNFRYYTVQYDTDGVSKYWIDMKSNYKAKTHDMLSNAHRRAATVKPNFPLLFYGHQVPNLTVATGGFIYLGDQVHQWLAATQYVAPLMANFDSSTSTHATVNYINENDFFAVEWNQVRLQDSPQVGPFTFQTTLFRNGTIVFVYKTIPIPVTAINDTHHPVKVGLSDAYIKDKNMLFVRQKTIYEYDRIDVKQHLSTNITNGTAIIFTPLTTCLEMSSCEDCTTANLSFKCAWCPAANRCSNGTDRLYQDWTQKGCDKPRGNISSESLCSSIRRDASSTYNTSSDHGHYEDFDHDHHGSEEKITEYVKKVKAPESEGMSASGVIGVMFLLMLVFGAVGWLAYAYFFPHSPSGQMLIRYRPSQWAFRRGEARYTAASIHM